MSRSSIAKIFALIPAAGSGRRMGDETPKQYLPLLGKPLLYHAVSALCRQSQVERVFVILRPGDTLFAKHVWDPFGDRLAPLYCGGHTRAATVFNGLLAARGAIEPVDWVLVHDAVRPCLRPEALVRLIASLRAEKVGGLLALPIVDTLKRAGDNEYVARTEPRADLWQAQTPQMFRYRHLLEALRRADPTTATDEASAIEQCGWHPKLVVGDRCNLKVTYPDDLELAEIVLRSQCAAAGALNGPQ